ASCFVCCEATWPITTNRPSTSSTVRFLIRLCVVWRTRSATIASRVVLSAAIPSVIIMGGAGSGRGESPAGRVGGSTSDVGANPKVRSLRCVDKTPAVFSFRADRRSGGAAGGGMGVGRVGPGDSSGGLHSEGAGGVEVGPVGVEVDDQLGLVAEEVPEEV